MSVVRFGSSTRGFRSGRPFIPRGQAVVMNPVKPRAYDKKQDKKINKISKAIRSEYRQITYGTAGLALTQAQQPYLLNGMAQGDGVGTREGNRILMNRLRLNLEIAPVTANFPNGNADTGVRVMLVYDKQANGAVITTTNLLSTGGTANANYMAPRNWDFKNRFQILYDRLFRMRPRANTRAPVNVVTTVDCASVNVKINKKINKKTFYNSGNAGTIADISTGSLYLLVFGEDDATYFEHRLYGYLEYVP